jgi:class 3 adenylate cyclase
MAETRKLAAILAADVAGYSKLAAADEERTLARLRALRSDLIDPTIALHHGRVVKRTGDGIRRCNAMRRPSAQALHRLWPNVPTKMACTTLLPLTDTR